MKRSHSLMAGLQRAVQQAGSVKALAMALGCSRSAVANWQMDGAIPASRVPSVAAVTGLPPDILRPDLFKPATSTGFAEAQSSLHAEATGMGIDADAITAAALKKAIGDEKARRWAEENAEAIAAHTRYVEEHGLPLAKYRMF